MDMQLLLLITAGILLPIICVIGCGESRKQHHETSKIRRREFLGKVAVLPLLRLQYPMSWMLSAQPRRPHRLFTHNEKSIVVVVEGENVRRMIELGLAALPGFSEFVRS